MAEAQYKYHIRLKQLIVMTLLVMVFFSLKMFLEGSSLNTAIVVASTLALTSAGWWVFAVPDLGVNAAINSFVILLLVGSATRIMARDYLVLFDQMELNLSLLERSKEKVEFQALHDQLTGLPNRLNAEQQFALLLAKVDRHDGGKAGLLYVDLDEFKDINDEFGHETGDRYLVQKSLDLRQSLRLSDVVCRIGGDEFLVLVDEIQGESLAVIAAKVQAVFADPVAIDGRLLSTTCSIGIVVVPDDANTYEQAVKRADIAMYRAKEQGKNQFHFYDDALETRIHRRLALQGHFSTGLENNEFAIYLQPIYELSNGAMVGAEALARWHHPSLGAISPDEFIALAESNGFIHELGYWVLLQACAWLHANNDDDFYISVNVSPLQLKQASFVRQLRNGLDIYQIKASRLKLEVTESQFIETDEELSNVLRDIHKMGIGLFLDDFGTGYSNLAQLQKMQFETIKIDRSFVADSHSDKQKPPLLRAIVSLATELNVNLVAEGVESEAEAKLLAHLGVSNGQGFFWQKPMPAIDLKVTKNV